VLRGEAGAEVRGGKDLAGRNPGEEGESREESGGGVLGAGYGCQRAELEPPWRPGSSPTRTRAKLQGGFHVGSVRSGLDSGRSWFHRSTSMHSALQMLFAHFKEINHELPTYNKNDKNNKPSQLRLCLDVVGFTSIYMCWSGLGWNLVQVPLQSTLTHVD